MIKLDYERNYYSEHCGVNLYLDHANKRMKILEYSSISEKIIDKIIEIAEKEGIEKIISNCRIRMLTPFRNCGFSTEGLINGYFRGENAYCISYFVSKDRSISRNIAAEDEILNRVQKEEKPFVPGIMEGFDIRDAVEEDIEQMTALFTDAFKTYPMPVFNQEYLARSMMNEVLYKVAVKEGKVVSIASAHMDLANLNAEITDCVTYPEYRGKGLLSNIMHSLEEELKRRGFYTAYSLTRAINPTINASFKKLGYKFTGRLINNCNICGDFEDMNLWVKELKS